MLRVDGLKSKPLSEIGNEQNEPEYELNRESPGQYWHQPLIEPGEGCGSQGDDEKTKESENRHDHDSPTKEGMQVQESSKHGSP